MSLFIFDELVENLFLTTETTEKYFLLQAVTSVISVTSVVKKSLLGSSPLTLSTL